MIRLSGISRSFSGRELFRSLDWSVKKGRKYGLVGPNGSGKTTLLEIAVGLAEPEKGQASIPTGLSVGYLPQAMDPVAYGSSVLERVRAAAAGGGEGPPVHVAEKILFGLGFSAEQIEGKVSSLSGGWRMRVELAGILLSEPGVLFLDEPTNHLDIKSIEWLEDYLKSYDGTVVIVSHDKYLLDRMVDTIAELEAGVVREFRGGYSSYTEKKEKLREIAEATVRNREKKLRAQTRFIERFRYKATKAKQVQSRIKMLEKTSPAEPVSEPGRTIEFSFPEPRREGRVVCELSDFSKEYEAPGGRSRVVFRDHAPLRVERGDRIAVTGRNGEGKTTLCMMIAGAEEFSGTRRLGHNVTLAYYAQNQDEMLNLGNTVYDEFVAVCPAMSETETRTLLGSFLFSARDIEKKISVLSGGEKSRLSILKVLVSRSNFLVLDEPTNHLDMASREVLSRALGEYRGTFLLTSHDRHFIDGLANAVWNVEEGKVSTFAGNYSEFLERKSRSQEEEQACGAPSGPRKKSSKTLEAERRNALHRELAEKGLENMDNWTLLSKRQMKKALSDLEIRISGLEREKDEVERLLAAPEAFCAGGNRDPKAERLDELCRKLRVLYDRWEEAAEHMNGDSP